MNEIRYVAASGAIQAGVHETRLMRALEMSSHVIESDAPGMDLEIP